MRLGGEEFLAILPGASVADAVTIAERMRRSIADRAVAHGDLVLSVTSSFGVVATPHPGVLAGAHLIARADEAMYAAKRAGRGRCSCPTAQPPLRLPADRISCSGWQLDRQHVHGVLLGTAPGTPCGRPRRVMGSVVAAT
ncbi:hypothetical protein BH23ACT3_BH23ACT3_08160 [soil metagenome]